jgi:hypothetical protein
MAETPVGTARQTPYSFELLEDGGVTHAVARRAGVRQLYYPYADEYRSYPPDVALLAALAERTGGKLSPSTADLFALRGDRGTSRNALWPWLAAIALGLYLGDIAVRRAPWLRRFDRARA